LLRIALVGALLGALGTSSAFAAVIQSQAPCVSAPFNWCLQFAFDAPLSTVREISFDAPGAGTAQVSFHGSMVCTSTAAAGESRVVDLVSQIVRQPDTVPAVDGPSGHRHAIVLIGTTNGTADSFNLNSTRTFPINNAGLRHFYYNMQKLRMDASTSCVVYNAVFTVTFIPTPEPAEVVIRGQRNCPPTCAFLNGSSPAVVVIHELEFRAPSAGTALVTFDGSALCYNPGLGKVVDVVGQIVTGAEVPAADGPGGMRWAVVSVNSITSQKAFSLAATRVFDIPQAGKKTFRFDVQILRIDLPASDCGVVAAGFTVMFVPA
jgi:hypothetical protein